MRSASPALLLRRCEGLSSTTLQEGAFVCTATRRDSWPWWGGGVLILGSICCSFGWVLRMDWVGIQPIGCLAVFPTWAQSSSLAHSVLAGTDHSVLPAFQLGQLRSVAPNASCKTQIPDPSLLFCVTLQR